MSSIPVDPASLIAYVARPAPRWRAVGPRSPAPSPSRLSLNSKLTNCLATSSSWPGAPVPRWTDDRHRDRRVQAGGSQAVPPSLGRHRPDSRRRDAHPVHETFPAQRHRRGVDRPAGWNRANRCDPRWSPASSADQTRPYSARGAVSRVAGSSDGAGVLRCPRARGPPPGVRSDAERDRRPRADRRRRRAAAPFKRALTGEAARAATGPRASSEPARAGRSRPRPREPTVTGLTPSTSVRAGHPSSTPAGNYAVARTGVGAGVLRGAVSRREWGVGQPGALRTELKSPGSAEESTFGHEKAPPGGAFMSRGPS